jgi:DNA-binding PadR family transcriptional regulator
VAFSLTKPSYVVLGMIEAGWRTGYDIGRSASVSTRFFWAASEGQIYPQLRKLAEAGLIEGEVEARGERERRVFRLTDGGRDALHAWLSSRTPASYELRDEGLLKLFFADELDVAGLRAQVTLLRRRHERVLEDLEPVTPLAAGRAGALLVLHHGRTIHRAIADWYAWLERGLEGAREDEPAARALERVLAEA